jgi:phosphatidylglycerophosphate synthase
VYPDKPSGAHEEGRRNRYPTAALRRLSATTQFFALGVLGLMGVFLLVLAASGEVSLLSVGLGAGLFALAMGMALFGMSRTYPHRSVGWCNTITVFRLMLVCVLVAWLVQRPEAAWIVIALALFAFALDGMDGWLARREGYTSDFGARFDMEVDSVFAMILALLAFQTGVVGWYVLLLGVPRYVFFFAQFAFPWLKNDLPPRLSRKLVCVLQIAVLILVLVPVMPALVANVITLVVLGVVGWSFLHDVRWLRRANQ